MKLELYCPFLHYLVKGHRLNFCGNLYLICTQTLCAMINTKLTPRLQAKPSLSARIVLPKHTGGKDVKNQIFSGCSVLGRILYLL